MGCESPDSGLLAAAVGVAVGVELGVLDGVWVGEAVIFGVFVSGAAGDGVLLGFEG